MASGMTLHGNAPATSGREYRMKMDGRIVRIAVACLVLCASAWGQAVSTSQITGVVKDETGAVLPGAEITVTQTDTAAKRTVIADETGSYILPNLPIGP